MTHEDRGHYAKKHPSSRRTDQRITKALTAAVSDKEIPCAVAFRVAADLNVSPEEMGFTIDSLEISITKCQLGLFGYHPRKRIIAPADFVSSTLEDAIRQALVNDRLSCAAAWEIAEKLGLRKMQVSSACESLRVKISSCQLGAFKSPNLPSSSF